MPGHLIHYRLACAAYDVSGRGLGKVCSDMVPNVTRISRLKDGLRPRTRATFSRVGLVRLSRLISPQLADLADVLLDGLRPADGPALACLAEPDLPMWHDQDALCGGHPYRAGLVGAQG